MIFKCMSILVFFISFGVRADEAFQKELTYMIGMVSKNFAESESSIQGENKGEAASGTAQIIAAAIQYKFSNSLKRSFYSTAVFPMIASGDNSLFSFGGGVEFYLNSLGSNLKFTEGGDSLKFSPKMTYFWGIETNLDYLVYVTESSKRSDLIFDLGVTGGGSYRVSKKINIKGILGISKGVGVNTSTMGMKFLLGYIQQFD